MLNSNISTSISGWFSQLSSSKEAEKTEDKNDENPSDKSEDKNDEPKSSTESETPQHELLSAEMQKRVAEETQKLMTSALSFGNYLFEVASETTKKVSTNLGETANNLKKTVENKTILGDLNREQNEFIRTKREKEGDGAVPIWFGYQEEEIMKEQILALSTDTRNFLRSPPSGVNFQFEMDHHFPVAVATLKEDPNLRQMRFNLVPTKVKEEVFWRNYFYRVSLIKQSAQLTTLAENQKSSEESSCSSSIVVVGSNASGTVPSQSSSPIIKDHCVIGDNVTSDDIHTAEFESDAFETAEGSLNPEDLEREMRELGMSGEDTTVDAETTDAAEWDVPVWEKEIQKALQAYEVVGEDKSDEWDQEIEDMLTEDTQA